jgi:hypothetical protein
MLKTHAPTMTNNLTFPTPLNHVHEKLIQRVPAIKLFREFLQEILTIDLNI